MNELGTLFGGMRLGHIFQDMRYVGTHTSRKPATRSLEGYFLKVITHSHTHRFTYTSSNKY